MRWLLFLLGQTFVDVDGRKTMKMVRIGQFVTLL